MSNVLVTGGAGYIGAHACKALAASGFKPIAYDSLVHGHEWAVQWGPLVKGDILKPRYGDLDQIITTARNWMLKRHPKPPAWQVSDVV